MDIEILTIGDELLTGHTVDTNSAFIAEKLIEAGMNVRYKASVGDSIEDIELAFRQALSRQRVVIATGGLGPTDDDLTKRALVKVFKRNLVFHEDILEELKKRWQRRNMEMPAINHNQALLPQGAKFFPNRSGSALGICLSEENRIAICLPGVPAEMKQILVDEVIPFLSRMVSNRVNVFTKLRTTGLPESKLAEMIGPKVTLDKGVKLAYLPNYTGTDLRILATDSSAEVAENKVQKLAEKIESIVGPYIFGRDNETLEGVIGQLLKDNDKTLSVAESCTGGQLGMTLTSVSGSSSYFVGGVLAYDNRIKIDKLGVPVETIEEHGAVSAECATAMAVGCRKSFTTDYALSITGVAGPEGGTEEKPVGTTFIGLASAHTQTAMKLCLGNNRETNRTRASYAALEMLRREILDLQ